MDFGFRWVIVEVNPNGPPSEGKPSSTLSLSHAKDLLVATQQGWGASPDTPRRDTLAYPGGKPQEEASLQ